MHAAQWSRHVRDSDAIPIDAVPVIVSADVAPFSELERGVLEHCDGMQTVAEIARASATSVDTVRALVLQLEWYGVVVIDELITVDEIDLLDDLEPEPQEEVIPLTVRKRRLTEKRPANDDDSPLASAIRAVAECISAEIASAQR